MNPLYTIGYSTFEVPEFIYILKENDINVVADVRSFPYSKFKPEFNREVLSLALRKEDIGYVFLGVECGARPDRSTCYGPDGKVDFKKLAQDALFVSGLERLRRGVERYHVAIMCAEKNPITCHRTILVAHEFQKRYGAVVRHLLDDDTVESGEEADEALLHCYDDPAQGDLFLSREERLAEAYRRRGEEIAYRPDLENQNELEHGLTHVAEVTSDWRLTHA